MTSPLDRLRGGSTDNDGDGVPDARRHDAQDPRDTRGARDAADLDGDGRRDDDFTETTATAVPDRRSVVARQKEAYGGIKFGSAFFGWLTATGTAVLLTALAAAAGAAVGAATDTTAGEAARDVSYAGAVVLLVILFVAYYCGGYVAGRMARFNGIKQGIAVWLWALLIAIVVAIVGAVAGTQYDVLAGLNGFPRLPVNEGDVTTTGVIAALLAAAAALVGAVFGGLAGMRFHRKVDKAGFEH